MPDSTDSILTRLREAAADDFIHQRPYVPLADAEVAVRDTRDATVQEIVDALNDGTLHNAFNPAVDDPAEWIARRFPNGGTHDELPA